MAGYGNKTAMEATESNEHETTRYGSHTNTEPYSGGHPTHKSGTVGGAGFGNKTGNGYGEDSRMGKVMEVVGRVTHNEGMVEKGRAKREEKGFSGDGEAESEK